MTIDIEGLCSNAKCYNVILKDSYDRFIKLYIAILNSSLFWFYMKNVAAVFRGDYYAYTSDYLSPFPIPGELSPEEQKLFISLVNKILALKQTNPQADTTTLERQIDVMVYKLYGLSPEEIKIVKYSGRSIEIEN